MAKKCAIYCYENVDGVTAAAILSRWAKIRGYSYKVGFLNYADVDGCFEEMAQLSGHMIFIVDFSPQEIKYLERKIQHIENNRNKIVYWNTHIKMSNDVMLLLKKYVKFTDIAEFKCSAEMVYDRFLNMDIVAKELKTIAHDIEFWIKKDERSEKLADLLMSGINKKELVESLARGVFWSDTFEQTRTDYLLRKGKSYEDLAKHLNTKMYQDFRFGFTLSSSLLSTADAGQELLDKHPLDVSVVLFRDGRIGFRRKDEVELDLRKVAKLFDGGGHAYASGGKLEKSYFVPIKSADHIKVAFNQIYKKLDVFFTG